MKTGMKEMGGNNLENICKEDHDGEYHDNHNHSDRHGRQANVMIKSMENYLDNICRRHDDRDGEYHDDENYDDRHKDLKRWKVQA